jgi:hypothetical protein
VSTEDRLSVRWRRALGGVVDPALRVGYMRVELMRPEADDVAEALDEVCVAAEQADASARDLLAAAAVALAAAEMKARRGLLRALAVARALPALGRLLRRPAQATATEAPAEDEPRPLANAPGGRALTLGERKSLARRPTRRTLDALMRDSHPMVVRALLANPRLTEDDVVRMAARRPGSPDALTEIARDSRWMLRPRVRRALVLNPATPPDLSVPLVRVLLEGELEEVAAAQDLPPVVAKAASDLLVRRARGVETPAEPTLLN